MHVLILGGSRVDRLRAASAWEHSIAVRPASRIELDPSSLPMLRPTRESLPAAEPRLLRIDDLETAFAFDESSKLRLIVTQSTYILQLWIDRLGPDDRIVATADREVLEHNAPEAFTKRGPWRFFETVTVSATQAPEETGTSNGAPAPPLLMSPAPVTSPVVELLRDAARCRERDDFAGALSALEKAAALSPDWEAVHYETGKFWLACDDMERAGQAFQRAADLMPTFAAAYSNLGATLGELDRPQAAVAAFAKALDHDPESYTILNNLGVVNRELGQLEESEHALTRVTELAPSFVFGHYNLGHTRFLRGDYPGALRAYEEGQRRDPEKNRRQGCRLALVRLALGDLEGADRDFWSFANQAPAEEREELLVEAYEVTQALMNAHPTLASRRQFIDRIASALTA